MLITLYNTIIYQPLFNLLVFFYNVVPFNDLGLAIVLLTILIRLILAPLFFQSIRSQRAMQTLQPKMEELKAKFKDDKEKLGLAMMELYKTEKINPLASCLPLLIQLPFLLAVYQVFRNGLSHQGFEFLYPFIHNPGTLNTFAFGFIDLAKPQIIIGVLAGLAQFVQAKLMLAKTPKMKKVEGQPNFAQAMNVQMTYLFPLLTVYIGAKLSAGLSFYWLITTLFTIVQQQYVFKKMPATPGPIEAKAEIVK